MSVKSVMKAAIVTILTRHLAQDMSRNQSFGRTLRRRLRKGQTDIGPW